VHRFSFAAAISAFALLVQGCPSKPKYPECKTDEDCAEQKQVCVEGFCKECRDDKQCKEGFICRKNACVPKPQCAADKDCPAGQKCKDEKCVPECTPETAAQECGEGKKCLGGKCAASDACAGDADCPSNQGCVEGTCKVKAISCGGDDDCPADAACVSGVCKTGAARKMKCELHPVHFDFDRHNIRKGDGDILEANAKCVQGQGAKHIVVEGHCDERGTTEYNLALGNRRASSVKNYLGKLLSDVEIETKSYGKEKPLDPAHNEEAWAKNRRGEIVLEK